MASTAWRTVCVWCFSGLFKMWRFISHNIAFESIVFVKSRQYLMFVRLHMPNGQSLLSCLVDHSKPVLWILFIYKSPSFDVFSLSQPPDSSLGNNLHQNYQHYKSKKIPQYLQSERQNTKTSYVFTVDCLLRKLGKRLGRNYRWCFAEIWIERYVVPWKNW